MIDESYSPDAEPEEVDPELLRPIFAPRQVRQSIFDRTAKAFETKFPIEDDDFRLEVSNVRYDEKRAKDYGVADTKAAIMGSKKLSRPLLGDVRLVDRKTREVIDERPGHLLANVPYLTDRGTFVMKGTEYVTVNQSRLRPGVYTRIQDNGELEAHVNTRSGTGQQMRVFMEPDTGIYRIKIGGSKIKMYPVMKALGVTDEEMGEAWGPEVLQANQSASDARAFNKFYNKLVGNRGRRLLAAVQKTARLLKAGDHQKEVPVEGEIYDPDAEGDEKTAASMIISIEMSRGYVADAVQGTPAEDKEPQQLGISSNDYKRMLDDLKERRDPEGIEEDHPLSGVMDTVSDEKERERQIEESSGDNLGDKRRVERDQAYWQRKREEIQLEYDKVQEPKSKAQANAGNYRKGHFVLHGLPIAIEVAPGGTRRGWDDDGNPTWEMVMSDGYGDIKLTESDADGDPVDVFVGPHVESQVVFVVDQNDPKTGLFDEHKCCIGFRNEKEAKEAYLRNYTKDWTGFHAITALTMPQFQRWIREGDTSVPASEMGTIKVAEKQFDQWMGVDLDGTLAKGVKGPYDKEKIGEPVSDVMRLVKKWRREGKFEVKLFTARAAEKSNLPPVRRWLKKHGLDDMEITNEKDPGMIGIIDDRAIAVARDKGLDTQEKKDQLRKIVMIGTKKKAELVIDPFEVAIETDTWHLFDVRALANQKSASKTAGFSRPENYDPIDELCEGSYEVHAGCMDWHCGHEMIWVEGDDERVWMRVNYPEKQFHGQGPHAPDWSKDEKPEGVDNAELERDIAAWGKAAARCWARVAKRLHKEEHEERWKDSDRDPKPSMTPLGKTYIGSVLRTFKAALEDPEMEKYVEESGEMNREWKEKKKPKTAADMIVGAGEGFDIEALSGQLKVAMEADEEDDLSEDERIQLVMHQLGRMELDPEVSYRNLGKAYSHMGVGALLDTSRKLLLVNQGKADPDDRDSLVNKTFHSADDFLEERILKDAGSVGQKLFWQAKYKRGLGHMRPGHFSPQLEGLIISNSLSQAISGINPVEIMDIGQKVTQVGEGGIGSMDAVPMQSRDVHPTQLGVVDPIRTAESRSVGIDQRFASAARKGPGNQVYFPVKRRKDGETVYRTPSQLYGKTIGFPAMIAAQNYLDPPVADAIMGDGIG